MAITSHCQNVCPCLKKHLAGVYDCSCLISAQGKQNELLPTSPQQKDHKRSELETRTLKKEYMR